MSGEMLLDTNIVIGIFAEDDSIIAGLEATDTVISSGNRNRRIILRGAQVSEAGRQPETDLSICGCLYHLRL